MIEQSSIDINLLRETVQHSAVKKAAEEAKAQQSKNTLNKTNLPEEQLLQPFLDTSIQNLMSLPEYSTNNKLHEMVALLASASTNPKHANLAKYTTSLATFQAIANAYDDNIPKQKDCFISEKDVQVFAQRLKMLEQDPFEDLKRKYPDKPELIFFANSSEVKNACIQATYDNPLIRDIAKDFFYHGGTIEFGDLPTSDGMMNYNPFTGKFTLILSEQHHKNATSDELIGTISHELTHYFIDKYAKGNSETPPRLIPYVEKFKSELKKDAGLPEGAPPPRLPSYSQYEEFKCCENAIHSVQQAEKVLGKDLECYWASSEPINTPQGRLNLWQKIIQDPHYAQQSEGIPGFGQRLEQEVSKTN